MTAKDDPSEFDLPAYLLGEIYGPMWDEGEAIQWSMRDSIDLATDLKSQYGLSFDPEEINEIMLEFIAQDNS